MHRLVGLSARSGLRFPRVELGLSLCPAARLPGPSDPRLLVFTLETLLSQLTATLPLSTGLSLSIFCS